MATSNWINFLILIVTVLAAVIAWVGTIRARNAVDEANAIQKQLLELERQRDERSTTVAKSARFDIGLIPTENYAYTFHCTNIGDGIARSFKVRWNNQLLKDMGGAIQNPEVIPDGVKPSETFDLLMSRAFEQAKLVFEWQDENGAWQAFEFAKNSVPRRK